MRMCVQGILFIDTLSVTMFFYSYDWEQNTCDRETAKPHL